MAEPTYGAWQRGQGSNLVGVDAAFLGSAEFNDTNATLRIAGARAAHWELFRTLDATSDPTAAAQYFSDHMTRTFDLVPRPRTEQTPGKRRYYRSSYLRLLRGWAYDSNSPEGAVLKGWVESRFGLFPTYHREPLSKFSSAAWATYVEQKMGSRFHNNAIFDQIDLLYEFAQWSLDRARPERRPWVLYRGINDFDEHPIVARSDRKHAVVRLNNLVSFTSQREVASCFGDCILETAVPVAKILFFNALLPRHALKGEDEVLVIGGDYQVKATYY